MAFQANKNEFARMSAVSFLGDTLHAYIDGREKLYVLEDALHEIEALFGESASLPLAQMRGMIALDPDCYDERLKIATQALQMIDRQTRGDWD